LTTRCALRAVWLHDRPLQVGLQKLLDAEGQVGIMKQELIDLQPQLIQTGKALTRGQP
jgi:hypothetical protein